jgi:hypothetical protein
MNDRHITEILDNVSIASLSESELNEVRTHALNCMSCRSAYEAARLSAVVLKSRAQTTIEPSPFFQTRVMAAWRQQQEVESVPAMFRLWRSARVLVSSMALATVVLGALSFVFPPAGVAADDQATASVYSAESVIMGQGADDQSGYEQVLSAIYEDDEDAR